MKLSTEGYKGVRDFYPEDQFIQNHIFGIWKKVSESFGYEEYSASPLEPAELYRAKSGEEIVNEQTYTFTDRGEREVTLRPEMTPTVARMVAGKEQELSFPLRWYSTPNLFRYEKPQKGRLREHFQLNVDLFGADGNDADAEIISIAHNLMKSFGAQDSDFVICLNSRKIVNDLYEHFKLSDEQKQKVSKLIDKKNKIPAETFAQSLQEIAPEVAAEFLRTLSLNERMLDTLGAENKNAAELVALIEKLAAAGIKNVAFDPTLMRGFDYYTGMIFEVFDTDKENPRSICGGGRYDDLLDIFGAKKLPTVGFAMGDVVIRDFLETHKLLPKYKPTTELYICTLESKFIGEAEKLANTLRAKGLTVAVNLSDKKVGDQIKIAHKKNIPFIIAVGENEITSSTFAVKNMETGEEEKVSVEEIKGVIE